MMVPFWCALFRGWGMDREPKKTPKIKMSLRYLFSLYMTVLLLVFTKAGTDPLPLSSGFPNLSFSFLSNRESALKRPGYLPDALWHGLQTATCRGALSLHMATLKTAKGQNAKGNTPPVSHRLMRRSHGFCQSLQELCQAQHSKRYSSACQHLENICTIRWTKERGESLLFPLQINKKQSWKLLRLS